MGRPERVVDVDVGIARQRRRELRVVLLLLGVEAEVLEQQRLAVPEPLDRVLRPDAERVAGHRDRAGAAAPTGRWPTGRSRSAVLDLAVGPAEVAGEDDLRALLEQLR